MVQEIEDEPKAMLGSYIYFHLVTLALINLRAFYTCSYSHNVHQEHQLTSHTPSLQHFQTPVKQECDNNHITTTDMTRYETMELLKLSLNLILIDETKHILNQVS